MTTKTLLIIVVSVFLLIALIVAGYENFYQRRKLLVKKELSSFLGGLLEDEKASEEVLRGMLIAKGILLSDGMFREIMRQLENDNFLGCTNRFDDGGRFYSLLPQDEEKPLALGDLPQKV